MSREISSDEGPSARVPFLHEGDVDDSDTGESSSSRSIEEVVVDVPERNETDLKNLNQSPKPRPVSLADNYEIVGGIPAFVWRRPDDYMPSFWRYAFSFDGTRLAVKECNLQICVYNVMDSFSLVAKGNVAGQSYMLKFAFWNHTNDRLVVCYDGKVALYSILEPEGALPVDIEENERRVRGLKLVIEHDLIVGFKDVNRLRCEINTFETSTWICGYDINEVYNIFVCCFDHENEDGFKTMKIESYANIKPTFVCMANIQGTLMGVTIFPSSLSCNTTRIWKDIDFSVSDRDDDPIVIKGQSFGFSKNGEFFLVWEVEESRKQYLKLFKLSKLKRHENIPMHVKVFSDIIFQLRASFLENSSAFRDSTFKTNDDKIPLIGFLRVLQTKVLFTIWNCISGEDIKEIDLTMKEMEITNEVQVELSLSPNMKWIALGCWNKRIVGLFCIESAVLIWSKQFTGKSPGLLPYGPNNFDSSGSKLIIDAHKTMYALAPACLLENCEIDYKHYNYDMDFNASTSFLKMDHKHQKLISKAILWKALDLRKGSFELNEYYKRLDVEISTTSNKICLLVNNKKSLIVLHGSFQSVLFQWYKMCKFDQVAEYETPKAIDQFRLVESFPLDKSYSADKYYWIFLYYNYQTYQESIVLIYLGNGISGLFVDSQDTKDQQLIHFSYDRGFYAYHEAESRTACIVKSHGVLVIDLVEREILQYVKYKVDLRSWFVHCMRCDLLPYTISRNGKSIAVAWNVSKNQRVILTSSMTQEESKVQEKQKNHFKPCCSINEDFHQVASFELDKTSSNLLSIVTYDKREDLLKKHTQENWNIRMKRVLGTINKNQSNIYDLRFDESNGSLWLMVLQDPGNNNMKLVFIPFNPYSMEGCLPSLNMLDCTQREIGNNELKKVTVNFGVAFITMSFNGKTNFQVAFEEKHRSLVLRLHAIAKEIKIPLESVWGQCWQFEDPDKYLKRKINDKDEAVVKFCKDLMEKKALIFDDNAVMLKECFGSMWLQYHALIESLFLRNTLIWKLGEIEVQSDFLHGKRFIKARMGTIDQASKLIKASDEGRLESYWKSINKDIFTIMEKQCGPSKEKATLKLFCMKDLCKVGLNGILRFLLMQEAPSHIFRTTLVKWMIIWKWENVWRERCLKELALYFLFAIGFSVYAICIGYIGSGFQEELHAKIFLSILLIILMVFALMYLYKEYIQLQAYIKDGRKLFPNDPSWGVRKYTRSVWIILKDTAYLLLLIVIPFLNTWCFFEQTMITYLSCIVALEVLLIWIKFWYYGQAFHQTGALVLMIENVIKDCVYFLLLAVLILIGFGLALFVLFNNRSSKENNDQDGHDSTGNEEDDNGNELEEKIKESFGSPIKAMLTLFYAMVGTFEVEVYFKAGSLAPLIIILFVSYIAIEMIVILNMLIAIMGDTFDRVKDTEEEQLLMGRARFIDACEASLTQHEIDKIEKETKAYLYALVTADEDQDTDVLIWKGRVKTLEKRVKNDIADGNKDLSVKIGDVQQQVENVQQNVESIRQELREAIGSVRKQAEDFEQTVLTKLEEMMMNLNEVKQPREDS